MAFAPHLIVEIVLDAAMATLGLTLIFRAQDNLLRRIWGIMVVALAASMIWDNVLWLADEPQIVRQRLTLLSLSMMMKWYVFVHILSLFTMGSLRQAWVTPLRIVALSLPLIVVGTAVGCWYWFGGEVTPLGGAAEILPNLGRTDVQLRLGVFVLSLLTPGAIIVAALTGKREPMRRLSRGMYVFIATFLLLVCAYVLFSMAVAPWAVYGFGYAVVVFPTVLSVMYLAAEDPLSLPCPQLPAAEVEQQVQSLVVLTVTNKLFERIGEHMKTRRPFADPDYALEDLMREMGTSRTLTVQAIKHGGFIGFREYVNFLRLEEFKRLAAELPGATIKELMFRCGFTSRSSFYRHFAEQESVSPKEYLEKLYASQDFPV